MNNRRTILTEPENEIPHKVFLYRFAAVLFLYHFFCFVYAAAQLDKAVIFPVFLYLNISETKYPVVNNSLHQYKVGDVNLGAVLMCFELLASLNHLWVLIYYDTYCVNISKRQQPHQWIEYSVSASLMVLVISMLCGIQDLMNLIVLTMAMATTITFGYLFDLYENKLIFWMGCIPFASIWIQLFVTFFSVIKHSSTNPPSWLFVIILALFILFSLFAVVHWYQHKNQTLKGFVMGTVSFNILSAVAKGVLFWMTWTNTTRLKNE